MFSSQVAKVNDTRAVNRTLMSFSLAFITLKALNYHVEFTRTQQ